MSVVHEAKTIPLTKLVLWKGNVRKTGADTAIDELAASIAAHGLLNPLTVYSYAKGKYCVIAGGRRLAALKALAKAGTIPKNAPIQCQMMHHEAEAAELSLAENVVRVAMHPADQFEAWSALAEDGQDAARIAERFGVAESTVRKRLALGRVSPVLFEAYRQGQIDLEALQAFTVTDDHDHQETVWCSLQGWQRNDARTIRHALTQGDVPTSDRRVQFVGLAAYEAAGGTVKRDLFARDGGGYCQNPALLDRLADAKLAETAKAIEAEGWAWVEARQSLPWDERHRFGDVDPLPLDAGLEAELEALQAEADRLNSDEDSAQERFEAIERRMAEIETTPSVWSDEAKAYSGAIVYLDAGGMAEIVRGLIRDGDAPATDEGDEDGGIAPEPKAPALPAVLIEDLTAHKTAALRIELARRPEVALAAVVHAYALSVFYHGGSSSVDAHLTVRSLSRSMQGHDEAPAVVALQAEVERVGDILPGNPADLWAWCLTAPQEALLDVLAVAVAHGVDAVVTKGDPNRSGVAFGDELAEAVRLDMAAWYAPTAERYFSRVPKALILSDLEAAKGVPAAPAWEKMKKSELAALAERETASTGWLPPLLR